MRDKGEEVAVLEARKHLGEYLRGLRGGAAIRAEIHRAPDAPALLRLLQNALGVSE